MPILYKVDIKKNGPGNVIFDPATLTVFAGDQISWTNFDTVSHLPGVVNTDGSFVGLIDTPVPAHGGVSATFSPSPQLDSSNNMIQYSFSYTLSDNRATVGQMTVQPTL